MRSSLLRGISLRKERELEEEEKSQGNGEKRRSTSHPISHQETEAQGVTLAPVAPFTSGARAELARAELARPGRAALPT